MWSDKATLGEIREHDDKNQEYILGKCDRKVFRNLDEYTEYQVGFIKRNLTLLCGDAFERLFENTYDKTATEESWKAMKAANVSLERRIRADKPWKNGYYVYKDGEIVSFLSAPLETMTMLSAYVASRVKGAV